MAIGWTLSDVVSRATQALGNRADITLSDASFWANEAQRVVWDAVPHDLAEALAVSSTTSGENRITLPSDFQELLNIRLSSSSTGQDVLQQLPIDAVDSASTALGVPAWYIPFNDYLELYPSPDSSYSLQLRYRTQLSTMTTLTTVLSVATRFRLGVYYKTVQLLAENVLDQDRATFYEDKYLRYMGQTPSDRALRQRERHDLGVALPRDYK